MKVGLIINSAECGRWKSFYTSNNQAYLFNHTLYNGPTDQDGIGCTVFRNIWNRPFMGQGYFINPKYGYPDIDLDVIFVVYESDNNPEQFINSIREKYSNAILIGTTKEAIPNLATKPVKSLKKIFELCDSVAIQFNEDICDKLTHDMGIKIHSLPIPYKIDYIRDKYRTQTNERFILAGSASWDPARGYDKCLAFAKYLGNKYDFSVVENKDDKTWEEWLQLIDKASFVINMDTQHRLGQVTIESIALGTPHIGGLSDTARTIMPEWATNNEEQLESIFVDILNNGYNDKYYYKQLRDRYNFHILDQKLRDIIKEVR